MHLLPIGVNLPSNSSEPVLRPSPRPFRAGQLIRAAFASALALSLSACSGAGERDLLTNIGAVRPPSAAELYSMGHLVEVQIDVAPGDWETLRFEGRDVIGVFAHTQEDYDYTYFDASVTIDGVKHEHAGVRKKGYWGSLSVVRPSFKIDIDRFQPGASHFGVRKLTLNNDLADPSHTNECMAFALFERAGLPASRCNLAHVVVNGRDLGTYSNVEGIDEAMLARHFSDPGGNLYEGQTTDFVRADLDRMELKTNKKKNDRSDLLALVEALEADDATLLDRLAPIVDIDRFRDYWGMELLVSHWDGYANNGNNYMAYHDPVSGRFQLLPWGTDVTFGISNPRGWVFTFGQLARRLYSLPEQRQRFWSRYAELADTVWDTQVLLSHIDQVAAIAPDAPASLLDEKREYVKSWPSRLHSVLGGAPPKIRSRARPSPCEGMLGRIRGSFTTTFSSADASPDAAAEAQVELSLDGEALTGGIWTGQAFFEPGVPVSVPSVRLLGQYDDGRQVSVQLYIEPSSFGPGLHPFHGTETYGAVNAGDAHEQGFVARVGAGTVTLTEAEAVLGAAVSGQFEASTYQVDCVWR